MRAAASSIARGSESRRAQSSAISSEGACLSALAEEGDGLGLGERRHRVLDFALDAQELARGDEQGEVGAALQELESSGAASITCSRLSSRSKNSLSPMCSARASFAPSVWAIASETSGGSRREASPTQKTPAL